MNTAERAVITSRAVFAALDVIDRYLEDTDRSDGPCGDALSIELYKPIRKAITVDYTEVGQLKTL